MSFGGITVDADSSTAATLVGAPRVEYSVSVRDGDDPSSPPLKRPLAVGDKVVRPSFSFFYFSVPGRRLMSITLTERTTDWSRRH